MRFLMSDRWFQDSKSPFMFQAAARRSACRAAARHSLKRRAVPGRQLPSAAVRSSDGARCSIVTMHTARMGLGGKRDLLVSGTDYSSDYSRSRSRERMEVTMFDRRGVKRRLGDRWLHTSGPSGKPRPAEEKREEGAPGEPSKVDPVDEGPGSHARESIWTTPNMITMTRIACSPVLSWFILQDEYEKALAGVIVAAFTDWLDGYIAKNYNQTSILGGFLDPLADKVLVAALALPLAYQGHLPAPLLVIWVGRDLLLVAGSFVKRAMSRPEGSPFFDTTSTATFQIRPNNLSKFNTALQFTVLSMSVSRAMWGLPGPEIFEPLCWLVGGTTVASGLTYLAGDGTGLLKKRKGLKK